MYKLTFQVIGLVIQRSVFNVHTVIHVKLIIFQKLGRHDLVIFLFLLKIFFDEPLKAFYILFDGLGDLLTQTFYCQARRFGPYSNPNPNVIPSLSLELKIMFCIKISA